MIQIFIDHMGVPGEADAFIGVLGDVADAVP